MKYFLLLCLMIFSVCSLPYDSIPKTVEDDQIGTWEASQNQHTGSQFLSGEIILKKILVTFNPNYPLIFGDTLDPDGDGKVPGLLLEAERSDLGIRFTYIYDLHQYYYSTGLTLQQYADAIDLSGFSEKLFDIHRGGVQIITGDWNSLVVSKCPLKPKDRNLIDYEGKLSQYTPIQRLVHRDSYEIDAKEYEQCDILSGDLFVDRELWSLNSNFAIRLPQCGSACTPGPDFRRAASIYPL